MRKGTAVNIRPIPTIAFVQMTKSPHAHVESEAARAFRVDAS